MTNKHIVIAIDGPAGAGKSTAAKLLAKKINFVYIDTGAMYRAVAYKFNKLQINLDDEKSVEEVLKSTKVEYKQGKLYLDNKELNDEIRTPEINQLVSPVSALKIVREYLTESQRKIGELENSILDGRDVGTAIFPNAEIKIFLVANPKKRAIRRYEENLQKGLEANLEEIEANMILRDKMDSEREAAPLIKASDAIEVDNSDLTPEEVVERIYRIYQEKINV